MHRRTGWMNVMGRSWSHFKELTRSQTESLTVSQPLTTPLWYSDKTNLDSGLSTPRERERRNIFYSIVWLEWDKFVRHWSDAFVMHSEQNGNWTYFYSHLDSGQAKKCCFFSEQIDKLCKWTHNHHFEKLDRQREASRSSCWHGGWGNLPPEAPPFPCTKSERIFRLLISTHQKSYTFCWNLSAARESESICRVGGMHGVCVSAKGVWRAIKGWCEQLRRIPRAPNSFIRRAFFRSCKSRCLKFNLTSSRPLWYSFFTSIVLKKRSVH